MPQFVPKFKCEYCGEFKSSIVLNGQEGLFVPCQCEEYRKNRARDHYIEMERRKQARRQNR